MRTRSSLWDVILDEDEQVDLPGKYYSTRTYRVVAARVQLHHDSGSVYVSYEGYLLTKAGNRHGSGTLRDIVVDAPELTASILDHLELPRVF